LVFIFCFLLSSGDSEVARTVIDESNAEGEEARRFLEDVRVTSPQVCGNNVLLSFHSAAVELSVPRQSLRNIFTKQFCLHKTWEESTNEIE
jgi:hypothetical protein